MGAAAGLALGGAALGWLGSNMHRLPHWLSGMEAWRAAMIVVALPGPLFVILVALQKLGRSDRSSEPGQGGTGFVPYARRNRRTLLTIFGALAAGHVALGSTLLFIPAALPRLFDIAPAAIGIRLGGVLAVSTLAGLIGATVALRSWRGDRSLAALRLARWFYMAAILPTMCLPFVTAPWQVFAITGIELCAAIGAASVIPGILQNISPLQLRGRVLALSSIITAVSQGMSPLMIGIISESIAAPRGLMIAIAAVALPGWIIATAATWRAELPYLKTMSEYGA